MSAPRIAPWYSRKRAAASSVLVAVSLLGLGSCVRYDPKPISSVETLDDYQRRDLATQQLHRFMESAWQRPVSPWPAESWDLESLTLAALYYHPELDVARAELAVAEAEIISAGQRPNPELNLVSQFNASTLTSIVSPWIVGLGIDIPIETGGRKRHRVEAATQRARSARLDVATVAWQVRGELRGRLLDLYTAERRLEGLRAQQGISEELASLVDLRFEAGEVGPFEATQTRVVLDEVRFALASAVRVRAEARVRLAQAIGCPAAALDDIKLSFSGLDRLPEEIELDVMQRRAVTGRPDILSSLSRYAASQAELQLEIARQYPNIRLGPGFELDQGDNKWTLGLGLELPLFNHNQGAIAEAQARRERAAAEFRALQARVIGEVESASTAFEESHRENAAAEEWVEHLRTEERRAWERMDSGDSSRYEYDLARLERARAEMQRLEALFVAQSAVGAIENAIQYPLEYSESVWLVSPRDESNDDGRVDAIE